MKLFAKRKRKVAEDPEQGEPERTVFQSDPVVEELLQRDPSEWNAKQRRMVQRYQKRNPDAAKQQQQAPSSTSEVAAKGDESKAIDGNNESESGLDKDKETNSNEKVDDKLKQTASEAEEAPENVSEKSVEKDKTIDDDADDEGLRDELNNLLEKLTSKQRRTLNRQLDRTGEVAAVLAEAKKLCEPAEEPVVETDCQEQPRSKRRKKQVDWSTLPPAERMRREEQRRLQQEAAERRARGEDSTSKFKHPLNSERRRANRRKPKYEKKKRVVPGNEHDTSGFAMRRSLKA